MTQSAMHLPPPTDDVEIGKRNLDRFGVTIHKGFLTSEKAEEARLRLEEQAEMEREKGLASFAFEAAIGSGGEKVGTYFKLHVGSPVKPPPFQRIPFLVNKGKVFVEMAKHPAALEYARHVMKDIPFNIGIHAGHIVRKGAPAQQIHVDQLPVPFWTPVPISINIMVALGRYEEDMGATRLIPGSHTFPVPDLSVDPRSIDTVPVVLEPGWAAIWESRVWHGQGESVSHDPRYSLQIIYMSHFLKTFECYPAALHDDVYEKLSDEERALYDLDYSGFCGLKGPRNSLDQRSNVGYRVPFVPELHREHE